MKLRKLMSGVEGVLCRQAGLEYETEISTVVSDSRKAEAGSLFLCLTGEKADGHRFIGDALTKGAAAVVIEKEEYCKPGIPWILVRDSRRAAGQIFQNCQGCPSLAMGMIGVTGTNGKTTVASMIAAIFEENQKMVGLLGTVENRLGSRRLPQRLTTPDSPELAALLAEFVRGKADYTVMEVSSHALAQSRVAGVEFDLAVFTNLSRDHLDYHGTVTEYLNQKAKLFSELSPQGVKKRKKAAILNFDDPSSMYLNDHCRVPVITYGMDPLSHVRADRLRLGPEGTEFDLIYAGRSYPMHLQLYGRFNVYNALAAAAAALVEGVPIEVIRRALAAFQPVPGRFQPVETEKALPFHVFVDYSHTPDSLSNCIATARELCRGRVITVFGAGGHRDKGKRPLMGNAAGRLSDICIVTSDNPREEDPQRIIDEILAGMAGPQQKARVYQEPDRHKAIVQAIRFARPEDIVLICGKGHETSQIIGAEERPFDDYEEAKKALENL